MQKKFNLSYTNTGNKRPPTLSLYEAAELFGVTPLSLACTLRDAKDAPEFFEVRKSQRSNGTTTNHLRYYVRNEIIQWWRNRNDTKNN